MEHRLTRNAGRRRFLTLGAALGGALSSSSHSQTTDPEEASRLGRPVSEYGNRSPFETSRRLKPDTNTPEAASTRTPLQDSVGILTPSSLHFERHHSGVPAIDPAEHRLLIHGMVERPLLLTVDDIRRLPSVSRIHFLECGGNSGGEWGARTAADVQRSHGLASCSEWTGAPLALLLEEAGVRPEAKWLLAEGADPCRMQRSVPIPKALDDILVAYGQNGEALRPEQGYPLRLVAPGWEGSISVKWLRRIKVTHQPHYTRDETSKYTELLPDGKARIFTLVMEAKSVITFPSGGHTLAKPGFYQITGLAWSGRGRISRVEITTDGGRTWTEARLQEPRLPMAFTRFRFPWRWNGSEAVIASRATDESGYVQPAKEELVAVRGLNSQFHYNGIKLWKVLADGSVKNADA